MVQERGWANQSRYTSLLMVKQLIQNGFFRKYGYSNVIVVNPTFEKFNLNSPRAAQYFAIKNLDKR